MLSEKKILAFLKQVLEFLNLKNMALAGNQSSASAITRKIVGLSESQDTFLCEYAP